VSLSGGTAGRDECKWRYEQGKERLETVFGLQVVEMPHTLASPEYVSTHPEARAADLTEILRVLREYGREDMPVMYNASIGHCDPHCVIPYGALAEIDCDNAGFSILESGVV
jgi:muramoyltetrapeptide carboxypeptidase LdcA involved in peptidoglycan recycling